MSIPFYAKSETNKGYIKNMKVVGFSDLNGINAFSSDLQIDLLAFFNDFVLLLFLGLLLGFLSIVAVEGIDLLDVLKGNSRHTFRL